MIKHVHGRSHCRILLSHEKCSCLSCGTLDLLLLFFDKIEVNISNKVTENRDKDSYINGRKYIEYVANISDTKYH